MALYPCQFGMHRYSGPQQSVYATVIEGNSPITRKARVCPDHFHALSTIAEDELNPVDSTMQGSMVCQSCDGPATTLLYLTAYGNGSEPSSFVGEFCAVHGLACLARLGWPEWPLRKG